MTTARGRSACDDGRAGSPKQQTDHNVLRFFCHCFIDDFFIRSSIHLVVLVLVNVRWVVSGFVDPVWQ
ncbi:hypothetical protein DAI22_12g017900 [Oryza sativa Japonica Group]|jgi:hypothetical protein|nr:hypothetical protein DAI22_12g017900 [Oryza sativa Japonica Group]